MQEKAYRRLLLGFRQSTVTYVFSSVEGLLVHHNRRVILNLVPSVVLLPWYTDLAAGCANGSYPIGTTFVLVSRWLRVTKARGYGPKAMSLRPRADAMMRHCTR